MRPRTAVTSIVPGSGRVNASANVVVTWDPGTPLADVEEAIKDAARMAVRKARVAHRIERADPKPQPPYAQLPPPGT